MYMKNKVLSLAVAATLAVTSVAALAQNAAIVNGKPVPSSRIDALIKPVSYTHLTLPTILLV